MTFDRVLSVFLDFDIKVFRFINGTLHNEMLAAAMKWTANDIFLLILVFGGMFLLVLRGGPREKINTAFALWSLILAHMISSLLLKPFFKRLRPPVELGDVNILFTMKKYTYAFPSTHTAMATALAVVLWEDYKNLRPALVVFVACVGFFCVYTGGHYPGDVAAGFALGALLGTAGQALKKAAFKIKE